MTESSVLLLPFTASSVGVARRRLVSDLIAAGADDSAICDAALVLSELLSNALRHAMPLPEAKLGVGWSLDADSVRVTVSDGGGQTRPELGEPTQATTGGRGLRIVEKLSRCWGTTSDQYGEASEGHVGRPGTTVWAQVPIHHRADMTPVGVWVAATDGGLGNPRSCPATAPSHWANSKHALIVAAWLPGAWRGKVRLVELNVSSRFHDDHTVVTICGEIDLYTAPRLHSELATVLADGMPARVVIDMSGVEFCDSTGMNVLLSCLRRVHERGGELEIASPRPAVRKILQVTGLDSVFNLVDEVSASSPGHAAGLNQAKPPVPQ